MGLGKTDLAFLEAVKDAGIVEAIKPELIDEPDGLVLITCGDCDHFPNLYNWLCKMYTTRIHLLVLNGGGLLLPSKSRVNGLCEDAVLIQHAKAAMEMKGIRSAIFSAHYPCGAAAERGINLQNVCRYIALGKKRLKRSIRSLKKVYSCLHIDYGDDKQKTYGVHTKEMAIFVRLYKTALSVL